MEKTVIILDPENKCVVIDDVKFISEEVVYNLQQHNKDLLSKIQGMNRKEISEAHSAIHTGEKMMPELNTKSIYSHLVGKWVKNIWTLYADEKDALVTGQWFKVIIADDGKISIHYSESDFYKTGGFDDGAFIHYFDVDNPRDYKPKKIPAEIMEGLMMLPTDHPEFGNIREKAIEAAEKSGGYCSVMGKNKLSTSLHWFEWGRDNDYWQNVATLAKSGAFDPVEKIPFSLEKWQSSDFIRVETRDGKEVTRLEYESKADNDRPIVAFYSGKWFAIREDGKYNFYPNDHPNDLFLIVKA